jgi:hypothetical protein
MRRLGARLELFHQGKLLAKRASIHGRAGCPGCSSIANGFNLYLSFVFYQAKFASRSASCEFLANGVAQEQRPDMQGQYKREPLRLL